MSTNAASAKKWVQENNPDNATLLNFIKKLEERLDKMDAEDPNWDGNEEALMYLQELVEAQAPQQNVDTSNLGETTQNPNLDTTSIHNNPSFQPNWDASSLTPNVEVKQELSEDKKREMFELMKQKVKLVL